MSILIFIDTVFSFQNGDTNKRPLQDSSGKDETKKLKLGKGSKSVSMCCQSKNPFLFMSIFTSYTVSLKKNKLSFIRDNWCQR